MNLKEMVAQYLAQGMVLEAAESHAASEVFLQKISTSSMTQFVTIKGGMVMYNLTHNARRATTDLDFDFIRYSIEDESIELFIKKLNTKNDPISVTQIGSPEPLSHLDYNGKRVYIEISDSSRKIKMKLDIGVHTYTGITQELLNFSTVCSSSSVSLLVNPNEQIFTEKMISLAKIGPTSTRYKDIYDAHHLITNKLLDIEKVRSCFTFFLGSGHYSFHFMQEVCTAIDDTLNNPIFSKAASNPKSNWVKVDYLTLKNVLLDYLWNL